MKVSRRCMVTRCAAFLAVGWVARGAALAQGKRPAITVYKEPT